MGRRVLVGASWDLIWWFVGAGAAFIVVHAAVKALAGSRAGVHRSADA